jgi:cytochrome c oxidase subunit IV
MAGHVSPKSTYYAIFGALMVGTVITVAAAFVNLGVLNFPVALAIAVTKATLVILFFMHVKYSSQLTKLFVGMAFFFLFVLFALTLTDYLSRGLNTYPGGAAGAGYSRRDGPAPGRTESVAPTPPESATPAAEGEPAH